ncbi:MAG TPA: hypothetical protein VD837_01670 [Terriglobales bacterium]|nr:hypothetical protein [Terriglobales bacterium]
MKKGTKQFVSGYTCHCGERVGIFGPQKGIDSPPKKLRCHCSKGHERVIRIDDIYEGTLELDSWEVTD